MEPMDESENEIHHETGDTILKPPFIALLCARPDWGKTTMIKYIALQLASLYACVFVIAASGEEEYAKDWDWLNKRFIFTDFEYEEKYVDSKGKERSRVKLILPKIMNAALKVKKSGTGKRTLVIVDDYMGLGKKIVSGKQWSGFITTNRKRDTDVILSAHQYQNFTSTLLRNIFTDQILGRQKESNGVKLLYNTFGKDSKEEFTFAKWEQLIRRDIQPHEFIHRNEETNTWKSIKVCTVDFRFYSVPEDLNCGKEMIVIGNVDNIDLSTFEKGESERDKTNDIVDNAPMFRDPDSVNNPDPDDDMLADLRRDEPQQQEVMNEDEESQQQQPEEDNQSNEGEQSENGSDGGRRSPKRSRKEIKVRESREIQELPADSAPNDQRSLMELIGGRIRDEKLSRDEQRYRHKMEVVGMYLQEPNNPDYELCKKIRPDLDTINWQLLPYAELKDFYIKYKVKSDLREQLGGINARYDLIDFVVGESASHVFDDNRLKEHCVGYFSAAKHRDIIATLEASDPFRRAKVDTFDKWLTILYPIAISAYSMWTESRLQNNLKENEHKKIFTEEQLENLLASIEVPPDDDYEDESSNHQHTNYNDDEAVEDVEDPERSGDEEPSDAEDITHE